MCLDCKIQRSDLTSFVDVIDYDIFKLVLIFLATSRKFGFTLNSILVFQFCVI